MSEYQPLPVSEQPPPAGSKTGLWIGVIGVAACLILVIVLGAVVGLGWLVYSQMQTDNATATAQANVTLPPPGWSSSLDDQFSSNQHDWLVGTFDDDYGEADLAVDGGGYKWTVKPATDEGVFWWEYPAFDRDLDDFYLSVDGRLLNGDIYEADYGLVFRMVDENNFYFFAVSEDQYMKIELLKDNEWLTLLDWAETPSIQPGEANRLAVLTEGIHYKFFVNGALVHELDDDQLSGGSVALGADVWDVAGASFEFDNFQVYEP